MPGSSSPATAASGPAPTPRTEFSWRALLPSSLISLSVHALILILAGLSFRGCEQGVATPAGGQPFREVGLAVIADAAREQTDTPLQNTDPEADIIQPAETETAAPTPTERAADVPAEAPTVAELLGKQPLETPAASPFPSNLPQTIGPGTPIGMPEAGGGLPPEAAPRGRSGFGAAGSSTPAPGETSFMDIIGNGQRFVYVIDTSASMSSDQRLDLAKSQLKGSLRLLLPHQEFQVLFYNESSTRMKLRGRAAENMYVATKVNVQLAEDEIDRVIARSGTQHKTPLLNALLLEPDVVYFLTDGDRPRLTTDELRMVKKTNRSRARIHVVEFAVGPREVRQQSWLELLAQQSGGVYRRINLRP